MKEKNRIENLLGQAADLIGKIQNHKGPISSQISPNVLEEIERLKNAIALFDELNRKSLEEAGIDMERLRSETMHSSTLAPKDKQLLERAKAIEKEAKNLQLAFSKVIERGKNQPKTSSQGKNSLKHAIKERRKRFKPLGGDKNWIPL